MESASADLTSQARIRNAAVAHFARDGFQKANLRAIAEEVGVSVALIFHHFGNKDGLRRACDEHVLGVASEWARAAGTQELLGVYLADPERYHVHVQYLARAIQEDAPAAGTIAGAMVDGCEAVIRAGVDDGTMRESEDPRAAAVLSILVSLAVLTMPAPLARALGYERFGPDVLQRMTVPTLELFTYGSYTDDTLLRRAEGAWHDARTSRQGKD